MAYGVTSSQRHECNPMHVDQKIPHIKYHQKLVLLYDRSCLSVLAIMPYRQIPNYSLLAEALIYRLSLACLPPKNKVPSSHLPSSSTQKS